MRELTKRFVEFRKEDRMEKNMYYYYFCKMKEI